MTSAVRIGVIMAVFSPLYWVFYGRFLSDKRLPKSRFPYSAAEFPVAPNEQVLWERKATLALGHNLQEGQLRLSAHRLVFLNPTHDYAFMLPIEDCRFSDNQNKVSKWLFTVFGLYLPGREFWVFYKNSDAYRFIVDNATEVLALANQLKNNNHNTPVTSLQEASHDTI